MKHVKLILALLTMLFFSCKKAESVKLKNLDGMKIETSNSFYGLSIKVDGNLKCPISIGFKNSIDTYEDVYLIDKGVIDTTFYQDWYGKEIIFIMKNKHCVKNGNVLIELNYH